MKDLSNRFLGNDEIAKGRRVLTTSDSQQLLNGLDKEHSVKLQVLASEQRKNPKKYLEDILDYYYRYL